MQISGYESQIEMYRFIKVRKIGQNWLRTHAKDYEFLEHWFIQCRKNDRGQDEKIESKKAVRSVNFEAMNKKKLALSPKSKTML